MMIITRNFTHSRNGRLEQYRFDSALNPTQVHFVDKVDGEPWAISIAEHDESLSLEDTRTLVREIDALCAFAEQLTQQSELRRSTEPGEPDLAGRGGGL